MKSDAITPQVLDIAGKRMIVLDEAAYEWLARKADVWEPALPAADVHGNRPADAYAAVSVARDILRARRRLGWSQKELARRAGVRLETLNRIELAISAPNTRAIAKIENALHAAKEGNGKTQG